MHRLLFFVLSYYSEGFYLQDESEGKYENFIDDTAEQEPCNARCQNGGQCFLSSFCICPKGYSGRYCEVSLHEQCGLFSSMTTIEIDCVLCICYNGLFMCDVQPIGFCHRKSNLFLTRSLRITHALNILQYRFKSIRSFQSITKYNVTLDDQTQSVTLNGYRIILNHSPKKISSFFLMLFCLLFIYLNKSL